MSSQVCVTSVAELKVKLLRHEVKSEEVNGTAKNKQKIQFPGSGRVTVFQVMT